MKKYLLVILSIVALVLSACSGSDGNESSEAAKSDGSKEKIMYLGINTPPSVLNPINARELNTQMLSSILFETLYDISENLEFLPKLAESMDTEDFQTFTVKIRNDVKWSDGEPFTTDDILFTLNTMANPKVTTTGLQELSVINGLNSAGQLDEGIDTIEGIEVVDAHTFKIHTKTKIDINILKEKIGVNVRFIPKHILESVKPEELHPNEFMQKPSVTNGPFTLKTFNKEQYVEFVANSDYYRGTPKLDKLFVKVLPSVNIVAELQTGGIDMNIPGIGPIVADDVEKVKNMSNVKLVTGAGIYPTTFFYNTKTVDDKKVRQAIAYAMNRETITKDLFRGQAEAMEGPYPPIHSYYNEDAKKYDYDPKKAKALLAEAGWDSKRKLKFAITTSNKTFEQAGAIIAENLATVGVQVEIIKYDLPTLIQKAIKGEYDIMLMGLPFMLDPDRSLFYVSGAANNFTGYSNAKVDELLAAGRSEYDTEARKVIYREFVDIVQEDLPMLTIQAAAASGAVNNRVKVAEPKDFGIFYNLHEWDVE